MYNAQIIKDKIKQLCKIKKINMEDMLISCNLGVNAVRQINDTKGMASFSLAKIADYLDCSVDYLLGRTEEEKIALIQDEGKASYNISNNSNSGDNIIGNKTTQEEPIDEMTAELIKKFKELPFDKKIEVFNYLKKI